MNDQTPSGSRWEAPDPADDSPTQPIGASGAEEATLANSTPTGVAPADHPTPAPTEDPSDVESTTALGSLSRREQVRTAAMNGSRWARARRGLLAAAAVTVFASGSAGFALGQGTSGGDRDREGITPVNLEQGQEGGRGDVTERGRPGGPGDFGGPGRGDVTERGRPGGPGDFGGPGREGPLEEGALEEAVPGTNT